MISDKKCLIIFLSRCEMTNSKKVQILEFLGEKASINEFKKAKLVENKILTAQTYNKILPLADEERTKTYLYNLENRGIYVTTLEDKDYPSKLVDLNDAPICLYYKGDLSLVESKSISIVGTRMPSNYGKIMTQRFAKGLAEQGITIISGLAYGVDSLSHRACLEVGGKTVAVLGCGLDNIYPSAHQSLADEIAQKGLLISEYPPEREANKYTFPTRNRIIAGLSDGVLITEAGIKSGTIYTKDYALDYGKNVYSVPGNVDSVKSELTNEIIKRGQALLVTCVDDILPDYSIKKGKQMKMNIEDFDENESKILELLKKGVKNVEQLSKICGLSINNFNTCLTMLEIKGIISRLPGGEISLN